MRRIVFLSFGLIAGICLLTACGRSPSDPAAHADIIELSDAFEFDLEGLDDNGSPVTDETYEGTPVFAYYGFASCPDVCPAALSAMSATLGLLGKDADGVKALFITVDPERDRPDILKAHLGFDHHIIGITGTVEQMSAARGAMRVYAQKVELPGSALGYTMDHQSLFYIIAADGTPLYALTDTMPPKDIAALLKQLIEKQE